MSLLGRWILMMWFYAGWFGLVVLTRHGLDVLTLFFPLLGLLLLQHLQGLSQSLCLRMLTLCAVGLCFDSLFSMLGIIHFNPALPAATVPFWLISLWLMFAILAPVLLDYFDDHLYLISAFGLIAGPLGYLFADFCDLLRMNQKLAFPVYGVFWAIFLPLSLRYLKGEVSAIRRIRAGNTPAIAPSRNRKKETGLDQV